MHEEVVVRAPAQLIVTSRTTFKETLLTVIESGVRRLVVDLSETSYIDSSGFGVLVAANKKLRERTGAVIILRKPRGEVAQMLEITGLGTLFQQET